ncbi:TonB-dependent siderophore receptor [Methylomicrobium sp. RS1]|uniref:TonB-dependent siderophore receptor n=1 Tax=Candidatus Methylomicrobium oryzae TaxID=2802053 RepID=UPI0019210524|nr:TonB-dependent siderophore receptor [Methylomicrobium sp. RS1]MBL1265183.1 TonB-dependent siderophore receptor [Methylomicrobium sp. RS1]
MNPQFGNACERSPVNEILRKAIFVALTTTWSSGDLAAEEVQEESGAAEAGIVRPDVKQSPDVQSEEILPTVSVVGRKETKAIDPVDGYVVKKSLSGSKTDTPLIEVPQSVSIINKDEFAARTAQSITQAVAYTPGVVTGMFGPSTRDDYFNLRGFEGTQYLDGTRLMSSSSSYAQLRVDPYGMERIEILRGPSSVLYGQNAPGGLVNMMSKRPTAIPFHEVQFLGGSYDRVQGSLDLSGPVAGRDDLLYRLVALGRGSDTQVDFVEDNRYYVAPSFTWKPSDATTFTFLSHYQKDETGNAMQFLPYEGTVLGNPNGRIPTSRFLGEPDFDGYDREQFAVGYAFEHRFNQIFTARQNLRYANIESDYRGIYPDYFYGFNYDTGRLIPRASFVDSQMRSINRYGAQYKDNTDTFTLDNQAQADFVTGSIAHTALVGVDYRHFSAERLRGFTDFELPELVLDIYNPVYGKPFARPVLDSGTDQEQDQIGVYAQDQIKWNHWIATIGIRHDWVSASTRSNGSVEVPQEDEAFTYRTGLSYLFDSGVAPYYSYSESFEPSVGTTFAGVPFKPTTGQQHEFGIKYQPRGYNALLTAAFFHLIQQNVLTADPEPTHAGYSIQTGEARSQGVELEGKATLDMGLNMAASYTYTDTKVTQSNIGSEFGNNLTYTPEHQAALWLDYTHQLGDFRGLGLGGGLRYAAGNYGDLSNSQKTPGYVLVDAAVHYDLGQLHHSMEGMRLGVNMSNLLDHEYFTTCYGGSCFYGDRRSVLASLRYNW